MIVLDDKFIIEDTLYHKNADTIIQYDYSTKLWSVCEDSSILEKIKKFEEEQNKTKNKPKKHYSHKQRKIYKLKRKNVVLGQQRNSVILQILEYGNSYRYSIITAEEMLKDLNKLTFQIGKNSAKIQRLRTLISQEKSNG